MLSVKDSEVNLDSYLSYTEPARPEQVSGHSWYIISWN